MVCIFFIVLSLIEVKKVSEDRIGNEYVGLVMERLGYIEGLSFLKDGIF